MKFRKHVCEKYLKHPLEYYEEMGDGKTNVILVTGMFVVRNYLNEMLPPGIHPNIGSKFRYVNKNIFKNEYLISIMEGAEEQCDY